MKNFLNKILKNKKAILSIVLFFSVLGIFGFINNCYAIDFFDLAIGGLKGTVITVVGAFVQLIVWVCGVFINLAIWGVIHIAQYNNFINEKTIVEAWVIVRDLCNMFFVLALLMIAFATILRIESYNVKKLLPKLLIMAVLINFSRIICGLIIDFSQVIMLTFVNAMDSTGGSWVNTLGVQKFLDIVDDQKWSAEIDLTSTVGGLLLAVFFLIISIIVMIILFAVLVMRVVMLWIYIVLSPLAFILSAFSGGQKYASQWWSDFTKQVVVGPILAFFMWLALVSANKMTTTFLSETKNCFGPSEIVCPDNFLNFVIAIGMLIGGLMVTQQIGGAAGSIAGKGLEWARGAGKASLLPLVGAKALGGFTLDKIHQKTGVDLNVARVWKGVQEKREEMKRKRYGEGTTKAAEVMRERGRLYGALAMSGTPGTAWEQIFTAKGFKTRLRGGKRSIEKLGKLQGEKKSNEKEIKNLETDINYKNAQETLQKLEHGKWARTKNDNSILEYDINQLEQDYKNLDSQHKTATGLDKDKIAGEMDKISKEIIDKKNTYKQNEFKLNLGSVSQAEIDTAQMTKIDFDKKINEQKEKIKTKDEEILDYKPIADYEAIGARGALEADEMKKITHIKDMDELSSMLRDAMKQRDKIRFSAIAKKLAQDGNENDGVLNNLGYSSTAQGLQEMIHDISEKNEGNRKQKGNYVGFTDQEAKALGMELSYIGEGNNHWGIARSFVLKDGRYDKASKEEQAMAAASEVAKMDPQGIARQLNRLGYGGENTDGNFELNETGLAILKAVGPKLAEHANRINPNAMAKLRIESNIKLMEQVGVSPELIKEIRKGTKSGEAVISASDAVEDLKKQGYF